MVSVVHSSLRHRQLRILGGCRSKRIHIHKHHGIKAPLCRISPATPHRGIIDRFIGCRRVIEHPHDGTGVSNGVAYASVAMTLRVYRSGKIESIDPQRVQCGRASHRVLRRSSIMKSTCGTNSGMLFKSETDGAPTDAQICATSSAVIFSARRASMIFWRSAR